MDGLWKRELDWYVYVINLLLWCKKDIKMKILISRVVTSMLSCWGSVKYETWALMIDFIIHLKILFNQCKTCLSIP